MFRPLSFIFAFIVLFVPHAEATKLCHESLVVVGRALSANEAYDLLRNGDWKSVIRKKGEPLEDPFDLAESLHHWHSKLGFVLKPITTTRLLWQNFRYQWTRRLTNGNHDHPAAAWPILKDLNFLLVYDSAFREENPSWEDFPKDFQHQMVTIFRDLLRLKILDPSQTADPKIHFIGWLSSRSDEELVQWMSTSHSKEASRIDLFKAIPQIQESLAQTFKEGKLKMKAELDKARERLEAILTKNLEKAWTTLESRGNSHAEARHRFVRAYLEAKAISEVLFFPLPIAYTDHYESHPLLMLEGARILRQAELEYKPADVEDLRSIQVNLLNQIGISLSTLPGITNQLVAQAARSGALAFFAKRPLVGRTISALTGLALMYYIASPLINPLLFQSSKDSKLVNVLGNRQSLLDNEKFKDARHQYLETVRAGGLTEVDRRILLEVLRNPHLSQIDPLLREKLKVLIPGESFDKTAVRLESSFSNISRIIGARPTEANWDMIRKDLTLLLEVAREVRKIEMKEADEALQPKAATEAKPSSSKQSQNKTSP